MMVLGGPATSSAPRVALHLLEVAHAGGHVLDTFFLYHNGAYMALNQHADRDQLQRLARLAAQSGLDCVACQSALARAAVGGGTAQAPFRPGGLSDWLSACERSDRVLRLGCLAP